MTTPLSAIPETAALVRPYAWFRALVSVGLSPSTAHRVMVLRLRLPEHREVIDHLTRYDDGKDALERAAAEWAAVGWPAPWLDQTP